jgi:hypothetical protein
MKKTFAIALSIIFVAVGISAQENKAAQEKTISDAEFKAVLKKSEDKTRGKNYRLKRSSKTYNRADNSLMRYFSETTEFVLPDSSRSVLENVSAGEKPTITETVKVGDRMFSRINNGSWQTSGNQIKPPTSVFTGEVEHIYKGEVKLGGTQVSLYESKYTSKTIKGGRDFVTVVKVKNWFGADGVLLRTEEEIETPNSLTKKVLEYEYNVNVKIEAPIK